MKIVVDRERAGQLGVNMQDITRAMVAATTSSRFTQANFWGDPAKGVSYNVQVQIPQSETKSLEDLGNVPVPSSGGEPILLRNIAKISQGSGPGQYERYNMVRFLSITANYHGTDLGSILTKVRKAITDAGAPPAKTTVDLRGQAPTLDALKSGFTSGLGIAVAVLFFLLAANFQSWRLAFAVTSTVPAVLAGIVAMLFFTGTTLNIQSAIGSIMAIGVAVANAILLVTFAERERLKHDGQARDGAIFGAASRLRPILMTSFAMATVVTTYYLARYLAANGGIEPSSLPRRTGSRRRKRSRSRHVCLFSRPRASGGTDGGECFAAHQRPAPAGACDEPDRAGLQRADAFHGASAASLGQAQEQGGTAHGGQRPRGFGCGGKDRGNPRAIRRDFA